MYERFEELCEEFGVTAYRVSKETGVAQSSISNWKNGISTPGALRMAKIAEYFGVKVAWLLGESDIKYQNETDKDLSPDKRALLDRVKTLTEKQVIKYKNLLDLIQEEDERNW